MTRTVTALLTARPAATTAGAAAIAALAAACAASGLSAHAAATAGITAAAYAAGVTAVWRRSLHRSRHRRARRDAADTVAYLAADLAAGTDPVRALAAVEPDWPREAATTTRRLTTAWNVATELGAPAAELCRRLADHLRDDERAAGRVRAQTASISATAALLTALPVAGVALGQSLGVDAVAFLLGTAPGVACLAAALALQGAGIAWTGALIAAVGTEAA